MNLLYLVFGNQSEIHAQANFSILTFLQQKEHLQYIIIVTDEPSYYSHLVDEKIKIEVINKKVLKDWKGAYDLFFRVKIKALEYIANSYKDASILYLDADTFLHGNLSQIKDALDNGNNVMHLNEGQLSQMKTKTTRKMWNGIKFKSFNGIKIDENISMWNAGVVGISEPNLEETIPLALAICDAICEENVANRLIEQFAFSVALNDTAKLSASESNIGHYWGNKNEWSDFINDFFLSSHLSNLSFEDEQHAIQNIDFTKLAVFIKTPNTRGRLVNFITKLFPDKHKEFIKKL